MKHGNWKLTFGIQFWHLKVGLILFLAYPNFALSGTQHNEAQDLSPFVQQSVNNIRWVPTTLTSPSSSCQDSSWRVPKECVNLFYLDLASQSQNSSTRSLIFENIENHELSTDRMKDKLSTYVPSKVIMDTEKRYRGCREECRTLALNTIYESLLAKNLSFSPAFRKEAYSDFRKIFQQMQSVPFDQDANKKNVSVYDVILERWKLDKDPAHNPVPASQKLKISPEKLEARLENNPLLALDLLYYNARKYDGLGPNPDLKLRRDWVYSNIIHGKRGERYDLARDTKRSLYGISPANVRKLKLTDEYAWAHGLDFCKVDPNSSTYNQAVTRRQMPLVCGISGSTNLAIWALLNSNAEFDEHEMRRFLVSVWSTLCVDGGHAFQEVLSAARLIADFFQSPIFLNDPYSQHISKKTIDSLVNVTRDINATGRIGQPEKFGAYSNFFSKMTSEAFSSARDAAQHELVQHAQESCH